jgi:hypothetical protein
MDIDIEKYLSKFRVFKNNTPFEPCWNNLLIDRCPLCTKKLTFLENGKLVICTSKKWKRHFMVSFDRLTEIKRKYS